MVCAVSFLGGGVVSTGGAGKEGMVFLEIGKKAKVKEESWLAKWGGL